MQGARIRGLIRVVCYVLTAGALAACGAEDSGSDMNAGAVDSVPADGLGPPAPAPSVGAPDPNTTQGANSTPLTPSTGSDGQVLAAAPGATVSTSDSSALPGIAPLASDGAVAPMGVASPPNATGTNVATMNSAPAAGSSPDAAASTPAAAGSAGALQIGSLCLPVCAGADSDEDADGCGFAVNTDCIMPNAEAAAGAVSCDYTGAAPTPGVGFQMGCACIRSCDSADSDPDADGVSDGWGWEFGATCMVAASDAVLDKLPCEPPPMPTGPGYLVNDEDGAGHCVPPCEAPELVADEEGWGWEHQFTCIVVASVAEQQVARCAVIETPYPFEAGDGYYVLGEDGTAGTCNPACSASADDGDVLDDGWGYELDRSCVFPDSTVAKVDAVPCVPPPSAVSGTCPTTLSCPVVNGTTLECGCTWVDGYAERKAEIVAAIDAAGTQTWGRYFLASSMMETDNLQADYPDGDVYPDGRNKTQDAYNAGLTKQNWGMIRQCHAAWSRLGPGDYQTARVMNTDLALDVQVYDECRAQFGEQWWSGHRNGSGSLGANTPDIQNFKAAQDWTHEMLQEGDSHYADDVYFWVDVTAI